MGRLYSLAQGMTFGLSAIALTACTGSSVLGGGSGGAGGGASTGTANPSTGTGQPLSKVDKIDILVSVDNSRSMADKQVVLNLALSDLVNSLVNPPCVDLGGAVVANQPASGHDVCPTGSVREHAPIFDIHIGILSTSLGGHGSDACGIKDASCPGGTNPTNNDAGHLLSRADACGAASTVPTYQNEGFLAWDPAGRLSPPGDSDPVDFTTKIRTMVLGVGQIGCGYESQLESWYRFLIDPEPYENILIQSGIAEPTGLDTALLQQRADFLRPDSLLAILMLSDEDDCSMKEGGTSYLAAEQRDPQDPKRIYHLPRPRHECASDPNDPCCKSCNADQGSCPPDPTCGAALSDAEDDLNLRCFDQKRRFGVDLLYPIERYVSGLTSTMVATRDGTMMANPLYSDLNPNDNITTIRDPGLVVVGGIIGVPWQLVARKNANGSPDLKSGFKTFEELSAVENGSSDWDKILGDPAHFVKPQDPHMVPSIQARDGLPPPGSLPNADPYNGHEYTISKNDDLQYACVFDLPASRDCSQALGSCDCYNDANDNPLCDPQQRRIQVRAKAYPATRQLSVLKGMGDRGVVSSICPSQISQSSDTDYAYRPAIRALVERIKPRLKLGP